MMEAFEMIGQVVFFLILLVVVNIYAEIHR